MKDERLARLRQMAEMVLETRSAELARATARRDALRGQLAALDRLPPPGADLAASQSWFAFEQWASARRAEINLHLAAREAERLVQLQETRRAFGRSQVLGKLKKV